MKSIRSIALSTAALMICCAVLNGQDTPAGAATQDENLSLEQKACYYLGFDFASSLQQQGLEVDSEQLLRGINDALKGSKCAMEPEEIQQVMITLTQSLQKRMTEKNQKEAAENLAAGAEYLKKYATGEGVKALPNGVLYRVLEAAPAGAVSPTAEDTVKVFYSGKTIDGNVFDSTNGRDAAEFPLGGLIRGMTTGIQAMKVGDKFEIVIPAELAYGENGPEVIGPNQVLIFEVELLEILPK